MNSNGGGSEDLATWSVRLRWPSACAALILVGCAGYRVQMDSDTKLQKQQETHPLDASRTITAEVKSIGDKIKNEAKPLIAAPRFAIALSGGGYRATLYHAGALARINDIGVLPDLGAVCSVSGGAISATQLGLHWNDLAFDGKRRASNFHDVVIAPVEWMTDQTIDVQSALGSGFLGKG